MNWLKRLGFFLKSNNDAIEKDFLDKKTEMILNEFDQEFRYKEVNDIALNKKEMKLQLTYVATELWKYVINASHDIYKKIQLLETDYIDTKSKLNNAIEYELESLEARRGKYKDEITDIEKELDLYKQQQKDIESAYNKIGEAKKLKGSLNRLHYGWFLFVMFIAGAAELFIYQNVFLSQEIGIMADKLAQDKWRVNAMALGMASGFTVMIIWLAHKMGEILRHLDSATQEEKKGYWFKFIFIALIVVLAIGATVKIRGSMHEILLKDEKITLLKEKLEESRDASMFGSDAMESSSEENGFSDEEEDDEGGFGSEESPLKPQNTSALKSTTIDNEEKMDKLRETITQEKGDMAWLFSIINFFIVVGGVFLSYETHTSSKSYETLEKHIKILEKKKRKLEQKLLDLEREIAKFKTTKIDKIFKGLLLKAALYDKEVRTYNAYIQVYLLKLQTIQEYLRKIYEENGVGFEEIDVEDIVKNYIDIDLRKELYHVKNIDEYMIYAKKKTQEGVS